MLHTHTHSHTLKRTLIQTSLPCRVGTRGKGLQYARISSCVLCVWSMQVCIFFYYAGCHTSLQTEICTHMQQSRPYLHIASLNVHSWAKAANFMKENHRWAIYSQNYPTRVQEWTLVWSKFHCIRRGIPLHLGYSIVKWSASTWSMISPKLGCIKLQHIIDAAEDPCRQVTNNGSSVEGQYW